MNKNNNVFKDRQILYSVIPTSKLELPFGLDEELEEYIKIYDSNISDIVDISDNISIKKYVQLGISALSLLDNNNFKFDEKIKNEFEVLRIYIEKCVNDKSFCKSNIFLAYIKDSLNRFLPHPIIYTDFVYNESQIEKKLHLLDNSQKLNAILFNSNKIKLKKDYICSGITDLLICSLFEIFDNNFYIKQCENCNRYFITSIDKKNIKYCNYLFNDTSLTCKQLMNRENYLTKRKKDIFMKKYNNLLTKYRNKYVRESEKINIYNISTENLDKYENLIETFKEEHKKISKLIKSGSITPEDGVNMLDKFDKEVYYNGSSRTNKK